MNSFHQVHALSRLTHGAFHLWMPLVSDHDDFTSFTAHFCHLNMHLSHQRAGCIKYSQAACIGLILYGFGDAVRRKNDDIAARDILQFFDENCAFVEQIIDDISIVYDLVAHIDRCAKLRERSLNDFERAIYSGTKATWLGEQYFCIHFLSLDSWCAGHAQNSEAVFCVCHRMLINFASNLSSCPAIISSDESSRTMDRLH